MSLKQIRGIGAVKQSWLRQVLNIRTIADLARADADAIEVRLRQAGHVISAAEIAGWISQAQTLLPMQSPSDTPSDTPSDAPSDPDRVTPDLAPPELVTEWETTDYHVAEWEIHSSLTLEYQTRQVGDRMEERTIARYRSEESTDRESFEDLPLSPTTERDHILQWFRQQLREFQNQDSPTESQTELPTELPTEPERVQVELAVTGIRSQQPIIRSQPFTLDVMFQLTGNGAVALTQAAIACVIQVEIRDRTTGAITLISPPPTPLTPNQLSYSVACPAVTLPLGIYRLQVLAQIPGIIPAQLKVPLLQVP
jgi:hypothetical protein